MVGSLTIARPGSDGTTAIEWDGDAPFFASCRFPITVFHAPGVRNEAECTQGDRRITYMNFTTEVPEEIRERKMKPCGHCGAKLYLEGKDGGGDAAASAAQAARPEEGSRPEQGRERTGATPAPGTSSTTSTFEQLRELMQWKRDGLLTDAEFQQAKEKILREEPDHEYACMSARVPPRSLATEDMSRDEGGESARVFGMAFIWEPIWVVLFCSSVHTVLRNVLKRGCQKIAKGIPKACPGRPVRPGLIVLEVSL